MCLFFSNISSSTNPKQWWICWLTSQRNHLSCETHHLWGASLRKWTPWMIILLKCIARGPVGACVTFQDWLGFLQFNPPGNDHISHLKEKKTHLPNCPWHEISKLPRKVYLHINDIILLTSSLELTPLSNTMTQLMVVCSPWKTPYLPGSLPHHHLGSMFL